MRRRSDSPTVAVLLAATLLATGCGGGSSTPSAGNPGPAEPPPEEPSPPADPQARLDRVAGCEDLAAALREDASFKIGVQADALRASGWSAEEFDEGGLPPLPQPSAPEPAPDPGVDAEGGPGDFTETNVQVAGVDEADIVETDGDRIYLLHGNTFVVVASWPPDETSLESTTTIEGHPQGMFVAGGRAAIFSSVYDTNGSIGGASSCGVIGPPMPLVDAALVGDIAPCLPTFTKITLLDVSAEPRVLREVYAEGFYTAARRHDAIVRVLVRGGEGLPDGVPDFWSDLYAGELPRTADEFSARVDRWEEGARAAIAASDLEDWLPSQWERSGGVLSEIAPLCSGVHVPRRGASEHGMTRILAFDMARDGGETHDALVLGGASEVYASVDRLVLAQREWDWATEGDRTALHLFAVGGDRLESTYLGSGYVPGAPLGQFSFDMQGDVLRVATTQSLPGQGGVPFTTASQIVTTRLDGDALQVIGSTGRLAPGERIFAVRYVGDRGYLVTFRQIDPLFVVDLSDAASPAVLGELELPGFSEYMHPLGDDHLLTIGQDADEEGRVRGLALRIFDVADDTNPQLAHFYAFSGQGWSVANQDHRAFTFDAGRGLLTFPYVSYEGDFRSVLELFSVDVITGFDLLGEVDHTSLTTAQCGVLDEWGCTYSPEIRRGLFIEDFLYSISGAGIRVHAAANLSEALSTVALPVAGGGLLEDIVPVAVP